jgi:hypothetical protein
VIDEQLPITGIECGIRTARSRCTNPHCSSRENEKNLQLVTFSAINACNVITNGKLFTVCSCEQREMCLQSEISNGMTVSLELFCISDEQILSVYDGFVLLKNRANITTAFTEWNRACVHFGMALQHSLSVGGVGQI